MNNTQKIPILLVALVVLSASVLADIPPIPGDWWGTVNVSCREVNYTTLNVTGHLNNSNTSAAGTFFVTPPYYRIHVQGSLGDMVYFRVYNVSVNELPQPWSSGKHPSLNLSINCTEDGGACTYNEACASGYCVHGFCRPSSSYCGDGYCENGEACGNCATDCGSCPGGGGGGGGSSGGYYGGGGGGVSTTSAPTEQPQQPAPSAPEIARATLDAPLTADLGTIITVTLYDENKTTTIPNARITVVYPSNKKLTLTTDADGKASYTGDELGGYDYIVPDYMLTTFVSTFVTTPPAPSPRPAPTPPAGMAEETGEQQQPAPTSALFLGGYAPLLGALILLLVVVGVAWYLRRQMKKEQ